MWLLAPLTRSGFAGRGRRGCQRTLMPGGGRGLPRWVHGRIRSEMFQVSIPVGSPGQARPARPRGIDQVGVLGRRFVHAQP
jgi:hypothetical protein